MPKKGEVQPYRVLFQYPGRPPGRIPHRIFYEAEIEAGKIGQLGADVALTRVDFPGDTKGEVLARFGPGHAHGYRLTAHPAFPDKIYHACACGFFTGTEDAARSHLEHAGLCSECWGTTLVSERATKSVEGAQKPMAGNLIGCPICGATGTAANMSFYDIPKGFYYSRFQMLELTTP